MEEILDTLNACYERLQTLQLSPTRHNMETLLQTLYDLQHIHTKLTEGGNDGRTEIDP